MTSGKLSVAPGQRLLACVKQVRDFDMLLALPNRLHGVVPCNMISRELTRIFSEYADSTTDTGGEAPSLKRFYSEGEFVVCVVTIVKEEDEAHRKRHIELSMLPSEVNKGVDREEVANGLMFQGAVVAKEDRGFTVDLGFASAFCNNSKVDRELVAGRTSLFTLLLDTNKRGPVLQVSAKLNRLTSEIFLKGDSTISRRCLLPGNLVDASVREVQETRYLVNLPGGEIGFLSFGCTDWKKLQVKERVRVRITCVDGGSIVVSGRPPVLQLGSNWSFELGSKLMVTCQSIGKSGVYFTSERGDCFASKGKLADEKLDRKQIDQLFTPSKSTLEARVIGADPLEGFLLVSLQPTVLNSPFISHSGVRPGDVVRGEVVKIADYGLLVQVADKIRAICPTWHLSDSHAASARLTAKYTLGMKTRFRVLEVDPEARKITLCKRKKLIESSLPPVSTITEARPGQSVDGYVVSVRQPGAVIRLYGALTAWLPVAELSDTEYIADAGSVLRIGQSITVKVKSVDPTKQQLIVSLKNNPLMRIPKRPADGNLNKQDKVIKDQKGVKSDIEPADVNQAKKLKDIFAELNDEVVPEDDTVEEAKLTTRTTLVRQEKDLTDEFERRLLATPNASVVWIEYASALLSIGNVDVGRAILGRALKTISIREQAEKLNIWTALLNIENIYGTSTTLRSLFERALNYTEPKHLYLRLVDIFIHSGKQAEAGELFEEMLRKFKTSCKVWLAAVAFQMAKVKSLGAARKLLPAALKSLPSRKHIKLTLKCAQLEYKLGEVERGRTLFEGLLAANPKRIDLWLVYIQMEENLVVSGKSNAGHVRRIYERALTLRLSSKKAKTFLKGFLAFEKEHGDAIVGVEHVKQLAREYVEGKPSN